jgi:predicted helicase
LATKERTYLFPLWLYPDEASADLLDEKEPRPNLSSGFLKAVATQLQLRQEGRHSLPSGLTPEDIFHYAYAVFHSPGYRSRYAEFLKIDFPRLPLTSSLDLFRALAKLGGELVALHLMESPKLDRPVTKFIGKSKEVTKVGWTDDTVWIDAGGKKGANTLGTSGFRGVPEEVWNFHIGGYQVCEKWLKDRKGRTLTDDDITHYHKIVVALSETIRLMAEIDEVIDSHGGWPGAFATAEK